MKIKEILVGDVVILCTPIKVRVGVSTLVDPEFVVFAEKNNDLYVTDEIIKKLMPRGGFQILQRHVDFRVL